MVFTNEARFTGGPDGMPVPRLELFGWRARTPIAWYWISGVTLVIGALIAVNLIESPTGRAFRAIHDSETAARTLGIDVARYKLAAFVLSAIYAAVAGAYLALFDALVTPVTAGFLRSIEFVTMAVIGGLGSILGGVVGAAVLVLLPQVLTSFHEYEHVMLGLLMMAVHDLPAARHRALADAPVAAEAHLSALAIDDVAIAFGGVDRGRGRVVHGRAGRDLRHHRTERRRQDHAVQHHRRHLPARARAHHARASTT